jgi:hypothetical protein
MIHVSVLSAVALAAHAQGETVRPATVEDATKVLDLAHFPLMEGAKINAERRLASLSYLAKGDPKSAYAFQKRALEAKGWKEQPGGYSSDMSCSGTFGKGGYFVSVSTFPGSSPEFEGFVQVQLTQQGNVALSTIPVPTGAKRLYSFPSAISYMTDKTVDDTGQTLRKLLIAKGWEPYGTAGDVQFFKQNAVRLSARSAQAPAQGNKTMIQLSSELMSADLPAPAETISTSYSDATKALAIDVDMTRDQLLTFYKDALGKAGWKPTTEQPINIDFRDMLIFNNKAKDILTLKVHTIDGKLRANLEHQTAAEFEEARRLAEIADIKFKADTARYTKRAAEEAARNRVIASVELPKTAKDVKRAKDEVTFTLAAGTARDAATLLRNDLRNQGWKTDSTTLKALGGTIILQRDAGTVTIVYVDTGLAPAEFTLSTIDADLDASDAK